MSQPPFVMSKYASREDLLSDAANYYESECNKLRAENEALKAELDELTNQEG